MKIFPVSILFSVSALLAAIPLTEVAPLPDSEIYGGKDSVHSDLIAATYNANEGPGIWITSDGGFRLYLNGELLAEDVEAYRTRFIPMTFLPGENAISVIATNKNEAGGILVQIDDLDKSYYSNSSWKAKPSVSNSDYKKKGRDLSGWGNASTYGNASISPSGISFNGFPANSKAEWIYTDKPSDSSAVLLFTFYIQAEGFGNKTTGGSAGNTIIAKDSASIAKALKSKDPLTILIPEGTYDFRIFRNAVTEAKSQGRTWCKSSCGSNDKNKNNTFYRIAFEANSCNSLGSGLTIVQENENLYSWSRWITVTNNKSLIGMGRGAHLRGAAISNRSNELADNNIYRNLSFYDVNPHLIEAGDGLDVVGNDNNYVEKFWADHISYKWISDGLDLQNLTEATISHLDYDGANEFNCYYYDPYMHLVQNAEITFANNFWENSFGRVPKVISDNKNSKVHIYNSYVDYNHWHILDVSGTSSYASEVLYENNYIGTANIQIAGKDSYSKINMKNTTIKKVNSSKPYAYNGTAQSVSFNDNVFSPSYSYELKTNSNLPNEIPNIAGIGGRFGKMPEYEQAFGISKIAPNISLNSDINGKVFDANEEITLNANVGNSATKVEFYVGNTLVKTLTSAPYQVNVSELSSGIYSAVAKAYDTDGRSQMSEFITFSVENPADAVTTLKKCGGGSSNQTITLGDSIVPFCYAWTGASSVTFSNFPKGLTISVDETAKKINISGTPSEIGSFNYIVSTVGGNPDTTINVRTINVLDSAQASTKIQNIAFEKSGIATSFKAFDLQGSPLYQGEISELPSFKNQTNVIIVEYNKYGRILKSYLRK